MKKTTEKPKITIPEDSHTVRPKKVSTYHPEFYKKPPHSPLTPISPPCDLKRTPKGTVFKPQPIPTHVNCPSPEKNISTPSDTLTPEAPTTVLPPLSFDSKSPLVKHPLFENPTPRPMPSDADLLNSSDDPPLVYCSKTIYYKTQI